MTQPEFALILNPASGSNDEEFAQKVRKTLEQSGRAFVCLETHPEEGAAPAVQQAIEQGTHTVIACGGDGTVMGAVNALGKADADLKLAIVPGGTANLLAQALGVPLDPEEAVAVALDGDERRIDLGQCGDTLFALGLGLGLTERLVSQSSAEEKDRLGKWAYVKSMLEEVGATPSTFTYSTDEGAEQSTQGVAVVIANTGKVGGKVEFAPGARMDDGKLDLVILHRLSVRDLFRLGWKTLFGGMKSDHAVTCVAGKSIHINSNPPLDLQIDGETVEMRPPLHIEVLPGALRVIVPSEKQKAALASLLPTKTIEPVAKSARWWLWGVVAVILGGVAWWAARRK